jgi:phenylacetate-CoA ligase
MAELFPSRQAIEQLQLEKLRSLLSAIFPSNRFYAKKLPPGVKNLTSLSEFSTTTPFTTKRELVEDQRDHPPYGSNLTFPVTDYTRCHQTSGTGGGAPLRWLDTPASWDAMESAWEQVHRAAGTVASDRVFFAFSFGPFLGFWLAFEAAERLGALCLSGGGLGTVARLAALLDQGATVLCCTPSYAIRLAEVAAAEKIALAAKSKVRLILVAGEPGGSVPATRARIEQLWPGARVFDHHGLTETGPVTFECPRKPGTLHVMEHAFYPEIIERGSDRAAARGTTGELTLTTLTRTGSPLLRYRTGDLVKGALYEVCACGRSDLALEGGILSRVDDMVVIRGVNVFPTAVEEIIRSCPEVTEYQVRVSTMNAMTELLVKIEADSRKAAETASKLENAFQKALSLRVPVEVVPSGSLPRFEMKAKRWVRE